MAASLRTEWDAAAAWSEVQELCSFVEPSVVLADLRAKDWNGVDDSSLDSHEGLDALRDLIQRILASELSSNFHGLRHALGDLRGKLSSQNPTGKPEVLSGGRSEERLAFSPKPSLPSSDDRSEAFRYELEKQNGESAPVNFAVPVKGKTRFCRIEASEDTTTSKRAAVAAVRKKGDCFYECAVKSQQEERAFLLSRAKHMYVRSLKLHPADSELYKKAHQCCIELGDLENAFLVSSFWICDLPNSHEAYCSKIQTLSLNSQANAEEIMYTLEEGYTRTRNCQFLSQCFVKAKEVADGAQKLQFVPRADDIEAVVLEMAKAKRFDVVDMLFLGGTSTISRGSGGFATAARCRIPRFPLAKFITSKSEYCTTHLLEQLLHCGVHPSGPPGSPPIQAWKSGRDDLLALLIIKGADLSDLQRKLFGHIRPDNILHGAVKWALRTGDIDQLKRVIALSKASGLLLDWECDKKGETVYTIACARKKRKRNVLKTIEYLADNEPDLNPEKPTSYGKSPTEIVQEHSIDFALQTLLEKAKKNYRLAHPNQRPLAGHSFSACNPEMLPRTKLKTECNTDSETLSIAQQPRLSDAGIQIVSIYSEQATLTETKSGDKAKLDTTEMLADVCKDIVSSKSSDAKSASCKDSRNSCTEYFGGQSAPSTNKEADNAWEVEWRQPVMKKLLGLNKSDRRKALDVIWYLAEGKYDKRLMGTQYKNGVHIRRRLSL